MRVCCLGNCVAYWLKVSVKTVGRFAVGGSVGTPVVNCSVSGVLACDEIRLPSLILSRDRIYIALFAACSGQRARLSLLPRSSFEFAACVCVSKLAPAIVRRMRLIEFVFQWISWLGHNYN